MTLQEANDCLQKAKIEDEEQLDRITPLYILLDLHKRDFCKIIDAVGLDKLLDLDWRWKRLELAETELRAKERYLRAKTRLEDLAQEREELENVVKSYENLRR